MRRSYLLLMAPAKVPAASEAAAPRTGAAKTAATGFVRAAIDEARERRARALIEMNFGGKEIKDWTCKGKRGERGAATSAAASNPRGLAAGINHGAAKCAKGAEPNVAADHVTAPTPLALTGAPPHGSVSLLAKAKHREERRQTGHPHPRRAESWERNQGLLA